MAAAFPETAVAQRSGAPEMTYMSKETVVSADLFAMTGPQAGQVTLRWQHKEDVDTYHIVFGSGAGQYQYGALNIGKLTEFTVGSLVPGRAYYFALVPVKGDQALYTSGAVRGVALGVSSEVVETKPENLIKVNDDNMMMEKTMQPVMTEDGIEYGRDKDADEGDDTDVQGVSDDYGTNDFYIPPEVEQEGYVQPQY